MPLLVGPLLASYGRDLFRRRKSLAEFTATVLAVQDLFRFLRPVTGDAWQQAKVWADYGPSVLTTPCSAIGLKAMVVVGRFWKWDVFAKYLVHGFFGTHRGIELRECLREDIFSPDDYLEADVMYTRVRRPKNAWAGPRIQHSVIDVPIPVHFLCSKLTHMARDARPYPFSRAQVRARWDKILEALGLPLGCLTPRSLSGGGTVWLF